jgi:hypothetical protein
MENEKPRYKTIFCIPCQKSYLSNYYYTHKIQRCHLKKATNEEIKNNLLKEEAKERPKENDNKHNIDLINEKLKDIIINLNNINDILKIII